MANVLLLQRDLEAEHITYGKLYSLKNNKCTYICDTFERAWLSNTPRVSCIPVGEYPIVFLPNSASGKYKQVYWLHGTEPRTQILIHAANYYYQLKGCIAPITSRSRNKDGGWLSIKALNKVRNVLGINYEFGEYIGNIKII